MLSYLFPYVAYVLGYHVAYYMLTIALRTRSDPSKMREYIDRKGKNHEASSFSQETIILEDMTKFLMITSLHGEESFNLTFS